MKIRKLAAIALMGTLGLGAALPMTANAKRGDDVKFEQQLTPEQQAQFKKIISESKAATADTRKTLGIKENELKAQMRSETPDTAKIETLSAEIGILKGKLLSARVAADQELKKAGLPTKSFDKKDKRGFKGEMRGEQGQANMEKPLTDK